MGNNPDPKETVEGIPKTEIPPDIVITDLPHTETIVTTDMGKTMVKTDMMTAGMGNHTRLLLQFLFLKLITQLLVIVIEKKSL